MTVVLISGDHLRHSYVAARLASSGLLSGWVRERREPFVPQVPIGLDARLARLFRLHFDRRADAEERAFNGAGRESLQVDSILDVDPDNLNGPKTHAFLREHKPDIIVSYGCHLLSEHTLSFAGRYAWNSHGGLSPHYRGVATHFWPSYLLEPQMTGMTLHATTANIDGGAIIHQTAVEMVAGDGLHDVAARAVAAYADELPSILGKALDSSSTVNGVKQKSAGRLWLGSMWRPEHLVLIYDVYEDRIVDRILDGTLTGRLPKLVSAVREQ